MGSGEKGWIIYPAGKTGKKQLKAWTDRLLHARNLTATLGGAEYVVCSSKGEKYSKSGFSVLWENARAAASEKLGRKLTVTFHDLKAKGISDYEGSSRDKQLFSGHKAESQVLVYDRKLTVSPTLDLPIIED
jgi:hypothetical protein